MSYITNIFKKLNSLKENYEFIPSIMYHATYKALLPSIRRDGLVRGSRKNWDISNNYIYLSTDEDNAYSYAETSEIVPEEWLDEIVVLKIDTSKLNKNKFDIDHNINYGYDDEVDVEDPYTWIEYQYEGDIPSSAIIDVLYESKSLNEDIDSMKKYYPNIPEDRFQSLIELDPTYSKGSNQAGKYAKWILGLANKSKLDNIGHVSDLLSRFDSVKRTLKNKDIMSYKSMADLEDALNDQSSYNELSSRQQLRQTQDAVRHTDLSKDAKLVYESRNWQVWIPLTYEASCKLGRDTSWCTATTESDYYYKDYTRRGPLYININKNNKDKFQFHFESESFMNAEDRPIDILEFVFEDHKDLRDFYTPIICKWLELPEGTDLQEYSQIEFDESDIDMMLSDVRGGLEGIDGRTAANLILRPGEQYGEWDFSYVEITDDILEDINTENRELIVNAIGSFDYEDIMENDDIRSIINNAAEIATESATIAVAHNDAVRALEKSVADYGRGEFYRESNIFNVTVIPYALLKEYYTAGKGYFNNILKDSLSSIICDNYRLYEPQYGWNEFSSIDFNNYLADNL